MLHGELLVPVVQEVLVIMKLVGTVPSSRWPVCIIFCHQTLTCCALEPSIGIKCMTIREEYLLIELALDL